MAGIRTWRATFGLGATRRPLCLWCFFFSFPLPGTVDHQSLNGAYIPFLIFSLLFFSLSVCFAGVEYIYMLCERRPKFVRPGVAS